MIQLINTLTFHSYKGGTGKTHLSANLAVLLSTHFKKRVTIFDCDFRAPSLHLMFGLKFDKPKNWFLNDYLVGRCELQVALHDVSTDFDLSTGSLFVAPANFNGDEINKEITHELDEEYQMRALQHMLAAREILADELDMDLLLIDTGPGFVLPSINAIIASDKTFLVTKVDEFDMRGTRELIAAVYDRLMEKSEILVNKVPFGAKNQEMIKWIEKELAMPVLWVIPCFCDVPREMSRNIFVHRYPTHEFSQSLLGLAKKILQGL